MNDEAAEDAPLQRPPRSVFARGAVLGKAAARASATQAKLTFGQPFRNEAAHRDATQRAEEETAKILFDACGVLRGTALKLAQVLALEPELVPDAFRAEFSRAAHRAPPINRALIRKILLNDLGEPTVRFAHFETKPFAAASFGQVHAATSHTGESLAVKVQYPGMSDSVKSDLAALKAILSPTRYSKVFKSCFDELACRLQEELDYRQEATHAAWFRQNIALDGIVVPRVHPELTTHRVLTTERLEGAHLADWLSQNPSAEARNHYGQLLVDLFTRSVFELKRIHADPNPGNYLFREDGRLGLLDFGCVRQLESGLVEALGRCLEGSPVGPEELEQLHIRLGVRYRKDVPILERREFLTMWGEWLSRPYRTGSFDFGQNQDYFALGSVLEREARRHVERYDGGFLYVGRAHHGLFRLLQALRATVSMNRGSRR